MATECIDIIIILLLVYLIRFRLVTRAKPVSWPGTKWTIVDDSRLLIGIYQYGLGNWENIKDDKEIGLGNKVDTSSLINVSILQYCIDHTYVQWCGNSQSCRTLSDKSSERLVN